MIAKTRAQSAIVDAAAERPIYVQLSAVDGTLATEDARALAALLTRLAAGLTMQADEVEAARRADRFAARAAYTGDPS